MFFPVHVHEFKLKLNFDRKHQGCKSVGKQRITHETPCHSLLFFAVAKKLTICCTLNAVLGQSFDDAVLIVAFRIQIK